jgi:hypothetical protein
MVQLRLLGSEEGSQPKPFYRRPCRSAKPAGCQVATADHPASRRTSLPFAFLV